MVLHAGPGSSLVPIWVQHNHLEQTNITWLGQIYEDSRSTKVHSRVGKETGTRRTQISVSPPTSLASTVGRENRNPWNLVGEPVITRRLRKVLPLRSLHGFPRLRPGRSACARGSGVPRRAVWSLAVGVLVHSVRSWKAPVLALRVAGRGGNLAPVSLGGLRAALCVAAGQPGGQCLLCRCDPDFCCTCVRILSFGISFPRRLFLCLVGRVALKDFQNFQAIVKMISQSPLSWKMYLVFQHSLASVFLARSAT